jgi:class 3 adenylate cyclase
VDPSGDGGGGLTTTGLICGACGAQSSPTAKFCGECGARLTEAPWSAEYKQVTVLFADVVHSMDIAAAVGAEPLREIMTDLVDRASAVVQRYGGTVDKFTGDGIMAVFGAPTALEDHALRACLAALGIQGEVKRLAVEVERRDRVDLRLRIGLNSGQVIAGEIGSGARGYTAIGEQVGMAQRMESVAPPCAVMLSESTARLVEGGAVLGEPEMVHIKGAKDPVSARQLLGMASQPGGVGRFETTLVGRQWEMNTVTGILDRSIGGHGCVVCVGGPAGIGKSRLVHETAAIARRRGVEVFSTFCESHAGDISFHVVARLLRAIGGISDLDGEAARARVRAQIPDADPQDLVLLDDLLGIRDPDAEQPPIDPAARRRRLTALINAASLARTEPVLYILEDAHWIDAVSESMLAEFLKVIPQTRAMALITYRPHYHGALAQVPGAHTLALAPLGDADTSALVGELLGPDPSVGAAAALITERTAGNPFFAQEMVRELAERGVLEGQHGRYRCRSDVAELSVPATVQAVIAARIDRLEPGAKQTLSAAAVIGSQFGPELLASLGIDPALEALVEAELVDQVRFTPRAEYAFRHPLIRAVAYESQLKSDRAKLHRRLAAAIEAGDPGSVEENASVIAENLEAAGDVQLAYGWHMRAGGWSTHRDVAAARLSWERAREIADALPPDDPDRTAMRIAPRTLLCGTAYRVHAKDSLTRFEELRELSTLAGDKASLAMGMAGQVMDHWIHARVPEASALADELMALVEAIADPDMTVGLSCMPTLVKLETGEHAAVARWSQRVIELADGDPTKGNFIMGSPLAFAHAMRALGGASMGRTLAEVLPDLPVAVAMSRETDPTTHAMVVAFTYASGICVGALLADDAALELIEEAVQIAERSADDFALGHARYALGLALMYRESPADRERGLTALEQLRDMCLHDHWTLSEVPFIEVYIAWEQGRRGDLDGAITAMRPAMDDLFEAGQFAWCITPTVVFVETLLARGGEADLQEAQAAIERLAAAPVDLPDLKICVLRLRVLLAGARGDEAAYRHLSRQHRAMAIKLGRLGHMAMADSWTVRAAAAGASRLLSASARMSRKPMWNKVIQWSTAPRRRTKSDPT